MPSLVTSRSGTAARDAGPQAGGRCRWVAARRSAPAALMADLLAGCWRPGGDQHSPSGVVLYDTAPTAGHLRRRGADSAMRARYMTFGPGWRRWISFCPGHSWPRQELARRRRCTWADLRPADGARRKGCRRQPAAVADGALRTIFTADPGRIDAAGGDPVDFALTSLPDPRLTK